MLWARDLHASTRRGVRWRWGWGWGWGGASGGHTPSAAGAEPHGHGQSTSQGPIRMKARRRWDHPTGVPHRHGRARRPGPSSCARHGPNIGPLSLCVSGGGWEIAPRGGLGLCCQASAGADGLHGTDMGTNTRRKIKMASLDQASRGSDKWSFAPFSMKITCKMLCQKMAKAKAPDRRAPFPPPPPPLPPPPPGVMGLIRPPPPVLGQVSTCPGLQHCTVCISGPEDRGRLLFCEADGAKGHVVGCLAGHWDLEGPRECPRELLPQDPSLAACGQYHGSSQVRSAASSPSSPRPRAWAIGPSVHIM